MLLLGVMAILAGGYYWLTSWYNSGLQQFSLYENISSKNRASLLTLHSLSRLSADVDSKVSAKARGDLDSVLTTTVYNYRLLRTGGVYGSQTLSTLGGDLKPLLETMDTLHEVFGKNIDVLIHQNATYKNPGDSVFTANASFAKSLLEVQKEYTSGKLYAAYEVLSKGIESQSESFQGQYAVYQFLYLTFNLFLLVYLFYQVYISIINPLQKVQHSIQELAKGDTNAFSDYQSEDELGAISRSVNQLSKNLKKATSFTLKMEQGDFSGTLRMAGGTGEDKAALNFANALNRMKSRMVTISENERIRDWTVKGLNRIAEIQRSNHSMNEFGDLIISELVTYTHTYQGGLYIVNDDVPKLVHLELFSCYAMGGKQSIQQKVNPGEGLVGQTFSKRVKNYITNIPDSYQSIDSGLGNAKPASILIIPLLYNDEVQGVIELASFSAMEAYEIEFVENIAISIGASIYNFKINEKTRALLEESQIQAEILKSNEEELSNVFKEVQRKEHYLNEVINISSDSIFSLDKNYRILSYNRTFAKALESSGMKGDLKGFNLLDLFPDETAKREQRDLYNRVFRNESFETIIKYDSNGAESHYASTYAPIYDQEGVIIAAACFSKDITKLITTQQETEALLVMSQSQTEELRAQEEELRQNMEELHTNQEEISNVLIEIQRKEHYLNEIINISTDSIFTINEHYEIVSYNHTFEKALSGMQLKSLKGFNFLDLFPDENAKAEQRALYERTFKGEKFEKTMEYDTNGVIAYYTSSYSPVYDQEGVIIAASCFAKDITSLMKAKKEAEELLAETQIQSEMLVVHEQELHDEIEALKKKVEELERKVVASS